MAHLSQFIGEDSRKPIERLRRVHLWRIADAYGITYPNGAPKTTMIALLEAQGIDVTQPVPGVQWQVVQGTDSSGRNNQEAYPVVEPGAAERKGVNSNAVLDQKLSEKDQQFEKKRIEALEKDNQRIRDLEEENKRLKAIIDERLSALETKVDKPKESVGTEQRGPNAGQREYWKAYRQAKDMGLPVKKGMTRDEIEALIDA